MGWDDVNLEGVLALRADHGLQQWQEGLVAGVAQTSECLSPGSKGMSCSPGGVLK